MGYKFVSVAAEDCYYESLELLKEELFREHRETFGEPSELARESLVREAKERAWQDAILSGDLVWED